MPHVALLNKVDEGNSTTIALGADELDGAIDASQTTLTMLDASSFSDGDIIKIDDEYILLGTKAVETFSGCTRAYNNSTGASHLDEAPCSGVFLGTYDRCLNYSSLSVVIEGTSALTSAGTLYMELSNDGVNSSRVITINIDDLSNGANPRTLGVITEYFRLIYVNLNEPLLTLAIETIYHTEQVNIVSRLNQTLTDDTDVSNVRAIVAGSDNNSVFRNIKTSYDGELRTVIHEPLSSFGDLRTVTMSPVVQLSFPYVLNDLITSSTTANGGTVGVLNGMAECTSGVLNNGEASITSIKGLQYRAGNGCIARFSGLFDTPQASSTQIIGVGNSVDGFFYGYNGTSFGVLHRNNSVDTWITQANWSEDTFDGTNGASNPTGILFNPQKGNVFEISYQWLGYGRIEFRMEDNKGELVHTHTIHYTNLNTVPSLTNPTSMPFFMEAKNTGNTTSLTLRSASCGLFVEGVDKYGTNGIVHSFTHSKSGSASEQVIFNMKSVSNFNELTASSLNALNKINTQIKYLSLANDCNALATFNVYISATIGGTPSYNDLNPAGANSINQYDTAGTFTSAGILLFSVSLAKDSGGSYDLSNQNIQYPPGSVITVTQLGASGSNVGASITLEESW